MARRQVEEATGHLWVEEGDRRKGLIAQVAPLIQSHRVYSFAVPAGMENDLCIGRRVEVPLGRRGRTAPGYVVEVDRAVWEDTLRPIQSVLDEESFLTPQLVALGRQIARHYHCPLGRTLQAMTPDAVRRGRGLTRTRYVRLLRPAEQFEERDARRSPKRLAVIRALAACESAVELSRLLDRTDVSPAVVRGLEKLGWVEIETRMEQPSDTDAPTAVIEPGFALTPDQRAALEAVNEAIDANRFATLLLFGVSGSGKTEVYIRAMQRVEASGRQAILLVPEIVLTTQLVHRLTSRFSRVAVNHSGLTDAQRSVIWHRLAAGQINVVVGTRSAVFAPCPKLGLICVDEEQETSFKNLQAPRFHVRDVAILRAQQLGIPVVLGSATPSVETWYNTEHRTHYRRVELPTRVNQRPLPKVHLVDMRDEYNERKGAVVFSRVMERLLAETLDRSEQAILLVNRRGFAHRVYCPACKSRLTCPNCNVGLVVHTASGMSICHYCRTRIPTPTRCPNVSCGETLVQVGVGTQRVEDVLARRFPAARVRRVDKDTMRHRDQYRRLVEDFGRRDIDVLVGTQMIAKGLDFPYVSFVGVLDADTNIMIGDFRAHERLFHLITQVAGRAGRADAPGRVVVQTATPELPALKFATSHDFRAFVEAEIEIRRRVALPPFRRLTRVVLAHVREETALHEAELLKQRIADAITTLSLNDADALGPSPCALSRLRGKYRYELLVRCVGAADMRTLLDALEAQNAFRSKASPVTIDVDPVAFS